MRVSDALSSFCIFSFITSGVVTYIQSYILNFFRKHLIHFILEINIPSFVILPRCRGSNWSSQGRSSKMFSSCLLWVISSSSYYFLCKLYVRSYTYTETIKVSYLPWVLMYGVVSLLILLNTLLVKQLLIMSYHAWWAFFKSYRVLISINTLLH